MSEQEIRIEDTLERIQIMLHLEEHVYACPDYLSSSYLRKQEDAYREKAATPLTVVEECAKLVTDLSLSSSSSLGNDGDSNDDNGNQSPSDVARGADVDTRSAPRVPEGEEDSAHVHLIPWRCQMCSWAYTVIETFGCHVSMVAIAFNLLDRYLARECCTRTPSITTTTTTTATNNISRQDFQLWSMTAVYLAIKLHDQSKLTLETLVDMSRGFFTRQEFEDTELDLLMTLQWHVSPPTALAFTAECYKLVPNLSLAHKTECAQVLARTVADSFFVARKPSQVAVAALLVVSPLKYEDGYDFITSMVDVQDAEFCQIYEYLKKTENERYE